jgi:hypothetical protein
MKSNYAPLFLLLFIFSSVIQIKADEYIWPTDASRLLSSSFAESRGSRFHAGIDIKTQGITGFPIVAIRDGHVSRIRVSPFGYGRALYLTLDTGEVALYGHLDGFNEEVAAYVKAQQKQHNSYDVQLFPGSTQFVFDKGDTLGYTGDSGVGYPHLHFEMRDARSNPINPLEKGYTVVDNIAPHISKILVQPLDALSMVNDDFYPQIYWTRSIGARTYVIDRAIKAYGRIGIGVSAFDQMDGVSNKFGAYRNELYIDGQLVYSAQYDKFSYAVNNHFKLDRDYRQLSYGKGYFYNLFVDFANRLPFYDNKKSYAGVVDLTNHSVMTQSGLPASHVLEIPPSVLILEGPSHSFEIVMQDYWGNASRVRGRLVINDTHLLLQEQEESILDTIYNASRFSEELAVSPDSIQKNFEIRTRFFDRFVRIALVSQAPLQEKPVVSGWLCSGKKYNMPLVRKSAHSFVGAWPLSGCVIGPMPLTIYGLTVAGDSLKQSEWMEFTTVQRGRTKSIFSADSLCHLAFGTSSLFKDIFVHIDSSAPPQKNGYDIVGRLYKIKPADVPLNKGVSLTLTYPENDSLPGKLAIYRKIGSRMRYAGGKTNFGDNKISTNVSGFGSFALVRDVDPPRIMALSPGNMSRTTNTRPRLRAVFKDNLSGIAGDKYRRLELDGEKVIAEYDPEKLTLIYIVEEPLEKGQHSVELIVNDKSGNSARRLNTFYID